MESVLERRSRAHPRRAASAGDLRRPQHLRAGGGRGGRHRLLWNRPRPQRAHMNKAIDLTAAMSFDLTLDQATIAVVGLGYVGLPLAAALGREFDTVGFDIHAGRVAELE